MLNYCKEMVLLRPTTNATFCRTRANLFQRKGLTESHPRHLAVIGSLNALSCGCIRLTPFAIFGLERNDDDETHLADSVTNRVQAKDGLSTGFFAEEARPRGPQSCGRTRDQMK